MEARTGTRRWRWAWLETVDNPPVTGEPTADGGGWALCVCVMNRGRRTGQRVVADVSTVRDWLLVAGARRRPSRAVTQEVAIEGRTRGGGVWGVR